VPDQPQVNLGRLTEVDRYFDQTKNKGKLKMKDPKHPRRNNVKKKPAKSCICSHFSMPQAKTRRATTFGKNHDAERWSKGDDKITTSSMYQATSAVHYHHGEHCRKRRMERNNEHPIAGRED
jgi:hypothetical protein